MAFPPKTSREQVMVLVTIAAIALGGCYWYYVFKPKREEIVILQTRVDSLDARNNRARGELAKGNLEQLKIEAEQYAQDLEVMRQLVPTGNEVPALLEQVSTAARRVGLDISRVEPEPVIEGDQFDTYRYKISVTGSYHAVAAFLANVGSLTRIIAPVNLEIAPATNANSNAARMRPAGASALDTKFVIQTYVVRTSARAGAKS